MFGYSYVLVGNFGNESIALMQWIIEAKLAEKSVFVSIDTGWACDSWLERVEQAERYATQHSLKPVRLQAPASMQQLVRDRKAFPNKKFQWCTSLLKGITLNAWLDEIDPLCESIIMLGKRGLENAIPEFIEQSEHYQQRKVWHPLTHHTVQMQSDLIHRAGFKVLTHRSLECDPCIHSQSVDLARLSAMNIAQTASLEQEIEQTMFAFNIIDTVKDAQQNEISITQIEFTKSIDMGCGSPWGCGE